MTAALRQVRVVVRGRVQGVGYRWFAANAAQRLGVAGWVRNAPDGCVELAAAGPSAVVDEFVQTLRCGPPQARVSTLEVEPLGPAVGASLRTPFEITR